MSRHTRSRNMSTKYGDGYAFGAVNNVPFGDDAQNHTVSKQTINDSVGYPVVDSNLVIDYYDKSKIELLSGQTGEEADAYYVRMSNYPLGNYKTEDYCNVSVPSGAPSNGVLATKLLAQTNPSRPDYAIGHYIQDFVELPEMIRVIGDAYRNRHQRLRRYGHKTPANAYLAAKFGWLPLYQDLEKLLDVFKYVDRRNNELDRLFSSSGLKRRARLGTYSATLIDSKAVSSGAHGVLTCKRESRSVNEYYGTVRWKPTTSPEYHPSHSEKLWLAYRTVLGATASGAFASSWDLIPWTWLLGWCTNVRDYVLAHGNTIPVQHSNICIMRDSEHTSKFTPTARSSWLSGGEGVLERRYRTRTVVSSASVSAYPPYLNGDRLSVLGALAVQRFR